MYPCSCPAQDGGEVWALEAGHRTHGEEMEVLVAGLQPSTQKTMPGGFHEKRTTSQDTHNITCATAETLGSPRATTLANDVVAQGVVSFNNFHP